MSLPPGGESTMNAAKLACAPECGWTLACAAPKAAGRSWPSRSTDHLTEPCARPPGYPPYLLPSGVPMASGGAAREVLARDGWSPRRCRLQFPIDQARNDRIGTRSGRGQAFGSGPVGSSRYGAWRPPWGVPSDIRRNGTRQSESRRHQNISACASARVQPPQKFTPLPREHPDAGSPRRPSSARHSRILRLTAPAPP
jgi:hypothetical protein